MKTPTKTEYPAKVIDKNYKREWNQVGVKFEITEGPLAGFQDWWNGSLEEGRQNHTIKSLKLTGWTGDFETWAGLGDYKVNVVVEERPQPDGTTKHKIRFVNEFKSKDSAMDAATAAKLKARYKSLVNSIKVELDPAARISTAPETTDDPF